MKPPTAACALVALLVLSSCATVSPPQPEQGPWGKIVQAVEVDGVTGLPAISKIRSFLKTEVGKPLRKEDVQTDQASFWKELDLRAEIHYKLVENGVKVIFRLEQITQATQDSDKRFVWGMGVSSSAGVRGTFQFNKRNFDPTQSTLRVETVK